MARGCLHTCPAPPFKLHLLPRLPETTRGMAVGFWKLQIGCCQCADTGVLQRARSAGEKIENDLEEVHFQAQADWVMIDEFRWDKERVQVADFGGSTITCGSHCSPNWSQETEAPASTEPSIGSDSEVQSEGKQFRWPASQQMDRSLELRPPLGDMGSPDDMVEPCLPEQPQTSESLPIPKAWSYPPTYSIDGEGLLQTEAEEDEVWSSIGFFDESPSITMPESGTISASPFQSVKQPKTESQVASIDGIAFNGGAARVLAAGLQAREIHLAEGPSPAGSMTGRPACPDLDTSSATSLDSLRCKWDRGSEQDFAASAPMSESQSKRVASSFLNDNDFFHVNEVDIESAVRVRHPLLEAVLQNRPRVVKALLLLGSRKDVRNSHGLTPLQLAEHLQHQQGGFQEVLHVFAMDEDGGARLQDGIKVIEHIKVNI
ncbi:unnamed protein product [Symbiodinium sp. CCMP2592]|nr:unnamed protein product [Symbiodinium sp. CCMP2592]